LDDPTIASVLPTSLRAPLSSSREMTENAFFTRSYFELGGNPPPGQPRYWSSYGPEGTQHRGKMELTFPNANQSRWVEIFVAGSPNAPGMSIRLIDRQGRTQSLAGSGEPGNDWQSVVVKVPPGKFTVQVQDDSPDHWLAVTNPREVGPLSHFLGTFIGAAKSGGGAMFTLPLTAALAATLWLMTLFWEVFKRGALEGKSGG
jgi:hypothetical protein